MAFKNDSVMDCGYFFGTRGGLVHIRPPLPDGTKQKPVLIPWDDLIDDSQEEENSTGENIP